MSSAAASPSLANQPEDQAPSTEGVSTTGSRSGKISQGTGSHRIQSSTPATRSASLSGSQDIQGHMAQEIAAENQKLIASMQPDQATSLPTPLHAHIMCTSQLCTLPACALCKSSCYHSPKRYPSSQVQGPISAWCG